MIDTFRDVQAAAADMERLQNEAASYASRVVPEARGDAERILQGARGYREQSVAEATGQTARFLNRAGRPSPGSRPDFGHGRTLHAVTTPFQPRLAATGRLLTRVWAARGASVGRERLRAVIPIAGGDEEHRADKPGRPEGNKGSDERPRHSADQHQACEVGDKSGDQRRCG